MPIEVIDERNGNVPLVNNVQNVVFDHPWQRQAVEWLHPWQRQVVEWLDDAPHPVDPEWVVIDGAPLQLRAGDDVRGAAEKNGPELWDKLLNSVKEIYEPEYVCVAGGAVRDYLLGKEPKDIDIFMSLPEKATPKTVEEFLELASCLGWKDVVLKGQPGAYGANKEVKLVIQANCFGRQVELIAMAGVETGKKVVDEFDFFICQHWYDGDVHSTPAAKRDLAKRVWKHTPKYDKLTPELKEHFHRVNKRHGGIYRLDEGEPWYKQFTGKEKIK